MIPPDFLSSFTFSLLDPARIPVALSAMVFTAVLGMISGPLASNANPFLWLVFDRVFGPLGRRLDRIHRRPADLMFRGFLLMAAVMVFGLLLGKAMAWVVSFNPLFGLVETVFLSSTMTLGSVWFMLLRLYFALDKTREQGKKPGSIHILKPIVTKPIMNSTRVDTTSLDDYAVTRVAMGFAARSFDKGLVAPVFWYLLGGLPLAISYSLLTVFVWRFGKDGFGAGFAVVPIALEKIMGIAPSLFAGLLISLASLLAPGAAVHRGVSMWLGFKNRAPYEQGGVPLSALAWTLKISLGGAARDLDGSAIAGVWAGPEGASAKIDHRHLKHAIYISLCAHILFVAALLGAYVWAGRVFDI